MFGKFAAFGAPLALAACAGVPAASPQPEVPTFADWVAACDDWDDWDKPGPPFRIVGGAMYSDTYYVGTCGIAAVLIETDDGLVLIDSGTNEGAGVVMDNIRRLGFAVEDIKILLTSHEHYDHVGGIARIQQASGAQLYTSVAAAQVFATGEVSAEDPQFGSIEGVAPARVDRIIGDGDVVTLGNRRFTAIATPGHTYGALSWEWDSHVGFDNFVSVVYADSLSPISTDGYRFTDHPSLVAAYREGLDRLALQGRCMLVTPHPSASRMRDRLSNDALGMSGREDCADYAANRIAALDARLAREAGEGTAE